MRKLTKWYEPRFCEVCGLEISMTDGFGEPVGPANYSKRKVCSIECRGVLTQGPRGPRSHPQPRKGSVVGVGSGGNQGRGEAHHSYKNGSGIFRRIKLASMTTYSCECCGVGLNDVVGSQKPGEDSMWCVHHIDIDKTNNELSNLQLLCKSCHQTIHEVYRNFPQK